MKRRSVCGGDEGDAREGAMDLSERKENKKYIMNGLSAENQKEKRI